MYPTLVFGILMLAAALAYARKPEARFIPLQVSLGTLTLAGGALGFSTGLLRALGGIRNMEETARSIWLLGLGEALNNLVLALMLIVFAALIASVGTLRLALRREPATA
jgi:hypothetical protein